MIDEHQVNSIIATALCDAFKNDREKMEPEQAKQLAKCILEALAQAGLQGRTSRGILTKASALIFRRCTSCRLANELCHLEL